jgi:hypothetical protein
MIDTPRFVSSLALTFALALAACDEGRTPPPPSDGGRRPDAGIDAGDAIDGGAIDAGQEGDGGAIDAGQEGDGGRVDAGQEGDGGRVDAGTDAGPCLPPPCPRPPPGCRYEDGSMCACGRLVCPMSDCGGATCLPSEYCDYAVPFACGGEGTCRPRPEVCLDVYMPVCGCDGASYSNECDAHVFGQDVAFEGECPPPTSCRDTGCPEFQYCARCEDGRELCLPLDATC